MIRHSEQTHQQLVERLPGATGRDLKDWMRALEDGPSFSRFDEKVNWLRDEHGPALPVPPNPEEHVGQLPADQRIELCSHGRSKHRPLARMALGVPRSE